ncbi:MAG: serine/threonine protein kinase [Pelosinus sp.]|nr:serine/threonine protein kinase [Pelosinus sp.]
MISKSEAQLLLKCSEVIKEFPGSGQKQVFLVKYPDQGSVIAKFVKSEDQRVKREIEIVTENNIINVPKMLEIKKLTASNNENYLCIIEQYIDGISLSSKIEKGKISIRDGLKLLETLLHIAVQLEELQVVHRDIKPDNIICGNDKKYYLIDFGIARQLDKKSLTMTQAVVGPHTPGYGAPELFQYSKSDIDIRADLFSIGVVLFQAITGEHPFLTGEEMSRNEIWYRTKTVSPKNVIISGDTSRQFISFIQTLMQKHPTRRPPTAKKALEWFKAVVPTMQLEGL